jgi:hypothetical protein
MKTVTVIALMGTELSFSARLMRSSCSFEQLQEQHQRHSDDKDVLLTTIFELDEIDYWLAPRLPERIRVSTLEVDQPCIPSGAIRASVIGRTFFSLARSLDAIAMYIPDGSKFIEFYIRPTRLPIGQDLRDLFLVVERRMAYQLKKFGI